MKKQIQQTDAEWAQEVVAAINKAEPQIRKAVDRLWDKHPNNPKNKITK